ncbi:MAG: hypothetical protein AAGA37_01005 [Actinomycetota bacterium]
MSHRRRLIGAALAAIVVALVVFGAVRGGDDGGGEAGEGADDSVTPTPADATVTVTEPSPTTTAPVAPEDIEPLDDAFDIDREFSADSEAESLGPIGTTETTIPTEEGEISIGGGDVPEQAGDFPLPEGYEVQLATEVPGELGFSGRVDGAFEDLVAFFEASLPDAGYEIVGRQEIPDTLAVLSVDGSFDGDVVISAEPGGEGWTVVVALAEADR